jgi:Fe-S-cluster containining protein
VRKQFTRRGLFRTSIIEDKKTCDCIFLQTGADGKRGCAVYPVRPNQCRTWPFWTWNLATRGDWEEAAKRCPGMNQGKEFTFEEIESLRMRNNGGMIKLSIVNCNFRKSIPIVLLISILMVVSSLPTAGTAVAGV